MIGFKFVMYRACRKSFYLILALLFLSKISLEADLSRLNANNDHGFWFEQFFRTKLSSDWSATIHLQERWGADYKRLWDIRNELVLQYNLSSLFNLSSDSIVKMISLGPGYAGVKHLQRNTKRIYNWVWLNIAILEFNMNAEIWDWKINQRLRTDYVSYTQKFYHDHGVLRYLVSLYTPWKFTCWNINPYVSNELFIRKNAYSQSNPTGLVGGLHLNQLRIGLDADIIEEFLSTSLYWELRVVKHKPTDQPQWFNIYIIGLAFNFTF